MKKPKTPELVAIALSVLAIVGAVVAPFLLERQSIYADIPPDTRVITLTGFAEAGVWTEEAVRGGDYWAQDYRAARPVLEVGEPVLLRLKSAGVVHTFYSPQLGVGPLEVYPGRVTEVMITPEQEGVFEYFCTTRCGAPHFAMRGELVVQEGDVPIDTAEARELDKYWLEPPPPEDASLVERGGWLFRQKGCATCHGDRGRGGVTNWNYVNETVPDLNTLGEKMFLFFPEDADEVIEHLETGRPLQELDATTAIRRFGAVLAQYDSVRNVIRGGNPPGKADPEGPAPPLEMSSWQYLMSDRDVDAVIAYLLKQGFAENAGEE